MDFVGVRVSRIEPSVGQRSQRPTVEGRGRNLPERLVRPHLVVCLPVSVEALLLRDAAAYVALFLLFALSAVIIASGAYNPFIYYRF